MPKVQTGRFASCKRGDAVFVVERVNAEPHVVEATTIKSIGKAWVTIASGARYDSATGAHERYVTMSLHTDASLADERRRIEALRVMREAECKLSTVPTLVLEVVAEMLAANYTSETFTSNRETMQLFEAMTRDIRARRLNASTASRR